VVESYLCMNRALSLLEGVMLTEPKGTPGPRAFDGVHLIGTGATSRVYRAERVADGRLLALKRLNRHLVRSSEALARLKRELELLQKLSHPGIMKVHDVIRWDGDPTLVMDYVEGEDLEARIVRAGPLDGAEAEALARALLDILATTHSAGIVHRDIKPHNIRLGPEGQVTLLDFGSARLDAASQLTATGTTVGTPEYMAPELFAGSVYDPRVDIFGVGATLYEALVGEPPQTADSLAELAWQRTHSPLPPVAERAPDTPEHLARFVDRCLATDPAARFSTASLAVWSLEHPEIERAFGDHRSKHPPCLHCDHPLPPRTTRCPSCKSRHPFGFESGSSDVVITSMSRPALFVHWLCARFPERASEPEVIADRCAALSLSQQHYVCGVRASEASREVERLAELGVNARVIRRRSWPGWILVALLGWLLMLRVFGLSVGTLLFVPAAALAIGVRWAVRKAHASGREADSLLGLARVGPAVAPGFWVTLGLFTVAVGMLTVGLDPSALVLQATLWGGLFASTLYWTLGRQRLKGSGAPRVLAPQQPGGLLAPPEAGFDEAPARQRRQSFLRRAWASSGIVGAAFLLVALEVSTSFGVMAVHEAHRHSAVRTVTALPATTELLRDSVYTPAVQQASASPGQGWLPLSLALLGPVLLALCFIALGRRRRKRLDTDRALIEVEVEATAERFAVHRLPPATRKAPSHVGPEEDLVALEASDDFTSDAVCRASTLAHFLGEQATARLCDALKPLVSGTARRLHDAREASLLARCILETDEEQDARFQFLALEGELEAAAAIEWWEARR
jgi:serine/threonine protein kinase